MTTRIALVTGGTGGLGTAICKALAAAGVKVVAGTTRAEKGQAWQASMREAGYDMLYVTGDVTDYAACAKMAADAEAAAGAPIDILVNNAGITRDGRLVKMTPENWAAVRSTNLDSVFNVTRQVIAGMLERGYGRIINISSVNGEKGQFGQTNYAAAKAGMHGFTMALALETAAKGITVNTISPGYIGTEMVMAVPEKVRESIIATIPVGRLGTPEEVGAAVAYVASDAAGYMTGANLSLNGGLHMH